MDSADYDRRLTALIEIAGEAGVSEADLADLLARGLDYAEDHLFLVGADWRPGDPVDLERERRDWARVVREESAAHSGGWPTYQPTGAPSERGEVGMGIGMKASEWTATWDGKDGSVSCGPYFARFTVNRIGVVKLIWRLDMSPGPNSGQIERAALQAADEKVRG